MKIAFLLTSFHIGGIEKVFITLANELCKNNDITLVVCKNEGELLNLKDKRIKIIDLGGIRITKLFKILRHYLKQNAFDIFISGADIVNIIVGFTNLFLSHNTKIVMTQHNFFNSESIYIGNKYITKLLMQFFYNRADYVVAVSKAIKDYCEKDLKCKKVIEIQNPVDLKRIELLKEEKTKFNLPEKYIVFAGRLSVVKNIPLILRGMKVLKEDGITIPLIILGNGPEEDKLKKMTEELGIQDIVKYVGSVTNVFPYIKAAEMLLMSSTSEAFPVTIIESFSLGIPVISTKTQGPLEIMGDLKANYFVNSFTDEKEFADKIKSILTTQIDRNELFNCAKQYDVENISNRYMTLFEKLMQFKSEND